MNYKKGVIGIVFLMALFSLKAQEPRRSYYVDEGLVPRPQSVDFTYLKLEASFEPAKGLINGKVTEKFIVLQKTIDTLFLDAVNIRFKSVELDGEKVEYRKERKGLTILFAKSLSWDSKHTLTIEYEANPKRGLYFIGWDDETNRSKKQIWTQGQGINNRHWIPMYDEKNDKLISEMLIEFDENYQVLSNGEKLKEKNLKNGKKLWHYKITKPHSPYLIMLGIGNYEIHKTKSTSGVPIELYYYPGEKNHMEPTYRYSVEMFDFFEKEIGLAYPWKSYSQIPVQDFMYGAMENTTATIFGDFYLVDDRSYTDKNYVRVNAHELAHQWFGDMVTARSSAHHWLQESFATHYDMVIQGEVFGKDHFDWVRKNYNDQAIEETKKDLKPIAHSSAGTVRHYPKGAFVLQMLKYVVGREQFNATIKHYLEKHAYKNVDSKNLLIAFHERLGLSLNWFWEQWVRKGGEPNYKVELVENGNKLNFYVQQIHKRGDLVGLFKMPIDFELHLKDGSKLSRRVWIEKESHLVQFDLPKNAELDYALFDPNNQVMKSVQFDKPVEMLKSQSAKAIHMLDRYDAIKVLLQEDFSGKDEFLKKRFKEEKFHGIKAEIVNYFVPQLSEDAAELIHWAVENDTTEVKKAILNNTIRITDKLEADYMKLLQDQSYEVVERALELLTFYRPDHVAKYLDMTKEEKGNRSHNIRVKWLEIAYFNSENMEYLNELVDYTSNAFEFRTRINAAQALKRLNTLNEKAIGNMLEGRLSFNSRLAGPMRGVLDHFFEQSSFKKTIINYVASKEWSDGEYKKVSKYLVY